MVSARDQALDTLFRDDAQQALTLGERKLAANPADIDARYEVGAALGLLASYSATVEGRPGASLGPARRAYREHARVLELDPDRHDAGLIVGLYAYAVAHFSVPARLLARLAGVKGDASRGLRLVRDASEAPSEAQASAMFTLILLYNGEHRYDEALAVIGRLQREFPRNRLLWLEAGLTARRARRWMAARAALEEGLARLSADSRPHAWGEDARWHCAYGLTLVTLHEIELADRELREALTLPSRDGVHGQARAGLARLADLAGDRAGALEGYRQAEHLCRQDQDDECGALVRALQRGDR
jgi:tetratricopeptide (TPR) repeat protein